MSYSWDKRSFKLNVAIEVTEFTELQINAENKLIAEVSVCSVASVAKR
jgi:hypothetical protein